MKVLGLIAEYNPFHNGHKYHLQKSKEITSATHTVAVMSGHFLQRGEPSIFDKWTRAQIAIKEGVDLVIEIPTVYACNSAEYFATGSIRLLESLNIVDYLSFGSESGDILKLSKIATLLTKEPLSFKKSLKKYIKEGLVFPAARQMAVKEYFEDGEELFSLLSNPNNILGIEYLKAIIASDSNITPFTITRIKADYHSRNIESDICSATAIRELLSEENIDFGKLSKVVPKGTYEIVKNSIDNKKGPIFRKSLEDLLLYKLRTIKVSDLKKIQDVDEGLENRIIEAAQKSTCYEELINNIKTKRYTYTRIQRIFIKALLDINEIELLSRKKVNPQYIRVLGFSQKGRDILKQIKSMSDLPIITNLKYYQPQNDFAKEMINIDINASNVYSLLYKDKFYKKGSRDFTNTPFVEQ